MKAEYTFIACVKTKRNIACKAKEMYISPLFKMAYQYALKNTVSEDHIYILSAKYGLIHNSDMIAPYEKTLNSQNVKERKIWSYRVLQEMQRRGIPQNAHIMLLGGVNYRSFLEMILKNSYCPIRELSMGKTLQWYKKHL